MVSNEPASGLSAAELEVLYRRLEGRVFNVVYRWLFDDSEAAEVTQEAFLRLWRRRASVRAGTAEALVFVTAIRLASNRRRARRLWRWASLEAVRETAAPAKPADEALAAGATERAVRAAVEALPEKLRRVVMLCEFSGLSHAEIARALRIPSGTVGSRRHEALRILRERLERSRSDDAA